MTMIDMSSIIKKKTNVTAVITRNSLKPLIYSCSNSSSLFSVVVVVVGAVLSLEQTSSAFFAISLEGATPCDRPSSKFASRMFSLLNLFSVSMIESCCEAGTVKEVQFN